MNPETLGAVLMAPVILIFVGLGFWLKFRKPRPPSAIRISPIPVAQGTIYAKYCTACGFVGFPIFRQEGSDVIAILLWLTFIVPGIIYTIWRSSTRRWVCASCGSPAVIPLDSPIAKQARAAAEPSIHNEPGKGAQL